MLKRDVKEINSSKTLFVPSDKTTNLYKVNKQDYKKLLLDNVTASYQKIEHSTINDINLEAKIIATKLNLDDRVEALSERNAFITLKDHKPNFPNSPKCRLINPTKSEIGKISKIILDNVNSKIRVNSDLNQWRNTSAVISWFQAIPNKRHSKFMKFDIVDFYPSISESLLWKALQFAKNFTVIDEESLRIIMHSRKSLLFCDGNTWIKKGNHMFDVTMGSFDGAEVCELVGLFLLYKMKHLFGCNCVGLYRDDGLAVLNNISGPKTDRTRKQLIRLFQDYDMKILVELNLTQTDFLDATLNLKTGKFWPYRKPNDNPLYVNKNSNHPPSIKKQIPSMVNDRLTQLSSSENEFDRAAPICNKALHESGYDIYLKYRKEAKATKTISNRRRRNIVWFNPPYSENVETNIDHEFLSLITKHFPKHHRLHKICNKSNIKISYSCMPNMSAVILRHNKSFFPPCQRPIDLPLPIQNVIAK